MGMKFIQQLKIKTSQTRGTPGRSIPKRSTGSVIHPHASYFSFGVFHNTIFEHPTKEDPPSNCCLGIKSIVASLLGSDGPAPFPEALHAPWWPCTPWELPFSPGMPWVGGLRAPRLRALSATLRAAAALTFVADDIWGICRAASSSKSCQN